MADTQFAVTDYDGHILESIPEMAEFMDHGPKRSTVRQGNDIPTLLLAILEE